MWLRSKKIIVTHSGRFHADDVFAVAALRMLPEFKCAKLVRTRDEKWFAKGDVVVDVGGIYDPEKNRFDHHQTGGAGVDSNGIPYCGFGLVWKKYGAQIAGSVENAERVRSRLVQVVDAHDNGVKVSESLIPGFAEYTLDDMMRAFFISWQEVGVDENKRFNEASKIAGRILEREICIAQGKALAFDQVEAFYKQAEDKRILVMDKFLPSSEVTTKYPEILFVVNPHSVPGLWVARAVEVGPDSVQPRKSFPKAWAGLRDEKMAEVSGVADAVFCHNALFLTSTKSKEGAIKLAQLAIENNEK